MVSLILQLLLWSPLAAAEGHWTLLNAKAPWAKRTQVAEHTTLLDRLYVIGGRSLTYHGDVWASDNGAAWELLAKETPWQNRAYHTVSEINGSLILLGGGGWGHNPRAEFQRFLSDVWRSDDGGRTWSQVLDDAPWGRGFGKQVGRGGHFTVAVNGSLLVLGGHRGSFAEFGTESWYGDVWRSDDLGATWRCIVERAPWFPRLAHQVVAMPDGALVLIGGDNFRLGNYTVARDVWRSEDLGASWSLVSHTPFAGRSGSKCVLYRKELLCLGGITGVPERDTGTCPDTSSCLLHDAWASADAGATWRRVATNAWHCPTDESAYGKAGCGRFDFGIAVKDDEIYTIGGDIETTFPQQLNSVWKYRGPVEQSETVV